MVYKAGEGMDRKEDLIKIFAPKLRRVLEQMTLNYDHLQEIRLRVNMPLMIIYENKEFMVDDGGQLLKENGGMAVTVLPEDIRETMALVSNYSLYA